MSREPAFKTDLAGMRFHRLLVTAFHHRVSSGKSYWLCQCDCGQEHTVEGYSLKSGRVRSCGCLQKQLTAERCTAHGHAKKDKKSGTYKSWLGMLSRVSGKQDKEMYADRGITLETTAWMNFEAFLSDMGERPEGTTLDRIDNDKGYGQGNCRWATPVQQSNNTRRNKRLMTSKGSLTIAEAARAFGLAYGVVARGVKDYESCQAVRT